jgi:hypothetical protein
MLNFGESLGKLAEDDYLRELSRAILPWVNMCDDAMRGR